MYKVCTSCRIEKPISEFSFRKSGEQNNQLRSHCKQCASERSLESQKRRRDQDPDAWLEYRRNAKRKQRAQRYGENVNFEELGAQQDWRCAICLSDISVKAYLDHNHTTGVVRGLLCFHCNVGLGHFRDSSVLLNKASAYLKNMASKRRDKRV